MPVNLLRRLNKEREEWHWTPWQRTRVEYLDNVARELVTRDSIESFPDGIFDDDQLRNGGFILYVLFGIYAFTLLAVVCNDYFIPSVELICEDLNIPQSDMGIGTIVGSAIFNALGVAAIGGLAAIRPIAIGMRPVTRDVVIYMVNVSVLVVIVWDGQVDWYEAVVLGVLYILYFILMFNSMRLFDVYDRLVARRKKGSGSQTRHTFLIPDSVMGMTFLAFGGCLPEAFSIFIMSRRGEGGIGVSNALGANSLAILFALGIPWLIKCLVNLGQGLEEPAILINSTGIDFVVGSLLVAVSCLWLVLLIAKFTLRKSVGFVLSVLYAIFITFAILVETGVILDRCIDC
ncbi:Uncharacterized protein OBRU01_07618 [Operophtera brumata]|uniref:Sodium/calcium exchanger membrane region domain-containing protein n=1 Tax=Operophtera brumata TaxID=104452 RepID=A0A0L7LJX3_OPEBR|nr:Uncharacterized protein OBRU01_07618 [Operophtera brumata]